MKSARATIRMSTAKDLADIKAWLQKERDEGVEGNFLCNWSVIEDSHRSKGLLVYVDGATRLPVAFQLGRLLSSGILQVRNEFRRRGIGRKLVERCKEMADKSDECLLSIQCEPKSSIPFWLSMGFALTEADGKVFGHQFLPRTLSMPVDGEPLSVTICFFPNDRQWDDAVKAVHTVRVGGVRKGRQVFLTERVGFHEDSSPRLRDVVVSVSANDEVLYVDKAKYAKAKAGGIKRCRNGYYTDCLQLDGFSD